MNKNFLNSKKILLIDSVIYLICLLGIYQLYQKAGFNPDSDLLFKISQDKLIVAEVVNNELKSKVQVEDVIYSINNIRVSDKDELEVVFDSVKKGNSAELKINRNGKLITHNIIVHSYYRIPYLIISLIVGSTFFFLGLFVYLKQSENSEARIFHWVALSVALVIMTSWGRYTIQPAGLGHLIRIIFSFSYIITPVIFIHLSLVFPRVKWKGYNKVLVILYSFSAIFFICNTYFFLNSVITPSFIWIKDYVASFNLIRWFFSICITIGIFNFIRSYNAAKEESERRKLRLIITGLVLGPLLFISLWQIPQALGYHGLIFEEIVLLLTLIMPLTFTISMVRYNIMNIDLIINRSTVYVFVFSLLIGLYLCIVGVAASIIGTQLSHVSQTISVIAAVIMALLFEPLRRRAQT